MADTTLTPPPPHQRLTTILNSEFEMESLFHGELTVSRCLCCELQKLLVEHLCLTAAHIHSMSQGEDNLKEVDPKPWHVQQARGSTLNYVETSISISTSALSWCSFTHSGNDKRSQFLACLQLVSYLEHSGSKGINHGNKNL